MSFCLPLGRRAKSCVIPPQLATTSSDVLSYLVLPLLTPIELCRLSLTCRRFHQLCSTDALWLPLLRKAGFSYIDDPTNNVKQFYVNLSLHKFMGKLEDAKSKPLNDDALQALSLKFCAATEIDLSKWLTISSKGIQALSKNMGKIHRLTLAPIGKYEHITDGALSRLTKKHPEITDLSIRCCPSLTPSEIVKAVLACKNLSSLELDNPCLTDKDISKILKSHPQLTQLTLQGKEISNEILSTLLKSCLQLTFLYLGNCRQLAPATLKPLETISPERKLFVSLHHCSAGQSLRNNLALPSNVQLKIARY